MKLLVGALLTMIIVVIVGLVFVYSGFYNVAASNSPTAFERWLLRTAMTHSVRRHAREVSLPQSDSTEATKRGAQQYNEMCTQCHGAPGIAPDEVGKGLTPAAPDLSQTAAQWSKPELFWIIKHGIQLTGMSAWGKTHSDEEIWALATFVQRLPSLSAEEYQSLVGRGVKRSHGNVQPHGH